MKLIILLLICVLVPENVAKKGGKRRDRKIANTLRKIVIPQENPNEKIKIKFIPDFVREMAVSFFLFCFVFSY